MIEAASPVAEKVWVSESDKSLGFSKIKTEAKSRATGKTCTGLPVKNQDWVS